MSDESVIKGSNVLYIVTNDGQAAIRADMITLLLRGNDSGTVDVQLISGHVAQLGNTPIDVFKELAMKWNGMLKDE